MLDYPEGKTPYSRDVLRKELMRRNSGMGEDEEPAICAGPPNLSFHACLAERPCG